MRRTHLGTLMLLSVGSALVLACGEDTGSEDAPRLDVPGLDGGAVDGGRMDGGGVDGGGVDAGALDVGALDGALADTPGTDGGTPTDAPALVDAPVVTAGAWSSPISLVDDLGRLAIANRVHVVGHLGGNLVHRSSTDDGVTWSAPTIIAPAAGNFPGMYGGLAARGDDVFLITGDADMASGPRQLDFRRSSDNGLSWSSPIRITSPSQPIFRGRIVVSGSFIHVVGTASPTTSASVVYFRSTDGGGSWSPGRELATGLGAYGGGQTVAVDGSVVHVAYTTAVSGVGAGPALYLRSTDGGATFGAPVDIGEPGARQARVQLVAVGGHVFACWQREAAMTGLPVPADRQGYNHSADGGLTWDGARVLPYDTGIDRNHQQVTMTAGGDVHYVWRSGDTTSDPAGYMRSRDYGATWEAPLVAIDTGEINHPYSVAADADAVHVLTGPLGRMLYARRPLR